MATPTRSPSPRERTDAMMARLHHKARARTVHRAKTRIANAAMRAPYDGAELRPFAGRPGAMDAFALPSVMGGRRVWRKGWA